MALATGSGHWLAIVNIAAGAGRTARAWPQLKEALAAAGVSAESDMTRGQGHATELASRGYARGVRRFLAVGGDGTLHEVLNGIGDGTERCAIAAAPLGTANDWARGLGIPRSPVAIAAMLRAEHRLACDVGLAEFASAGEHRRRRFINVAGAGYDAFVLERLPRRGPQRLRYLWALASNLTAYRPPLFRVECDGRSFEERLLVAFAALGRYCGGGLEFASDASPSDGLLDLVAIKAIGPLAVLARLPKAYGGRIAKDPVAITGRGPSVLIDADRPTGVEADGQLLGTTPCALRVLPGAIDAVVP
ncbi:MAG TPA: diacylglycerol kinase family protein [Steroidobacteraceae bacterium]|nr:diacylglycerol kinase family protein [Steroidobacteraceae bacterium]